MNVNWHCSRNGRKSSGFEPSKASGAHRCVELEWGVSAVNCGATGRFVAVVVCPSIAIACTSRLMRSSAGVGGFGFGRVIGVGIGYWVSSGLSALSFSSSFVLGSISNHSRSNGLVSNGVLNQTEVGK